MIPDNNSHLSYILSKINDDAIIGAIEYTAQYKIRVRHEYLGCCVELFQDSIFDHTSFGYMLKVGANDLV